MAKEQIKAMQWAFNGDSYRPSGETVSVLPPGMYKVRTTMMGSFLEKADLNTDDLLVLDESPATQVIRNVRKFWAIKDTFKQLGLVHKRGLLLYGKPGVGKTGVVEILAQDIIKDDGIVLLCEDAQSAEIGLKMVRSVEKTCKIVVVIEDLDTIMSNKGLESKLSNLLDGENQVENVVYVATTNFIDKIPARFKNRPSRFDEVLEVPMPTAAMREAFLRAKIPAGLYPPGTIEVWASETEGLALSHLRELLVGVVALERPYKEVLDRLKKMASVGPVTLVAHGKVAEA